MKEADIIGHILFSQIFIETYDGVITTIGLAPMAVKPEFQGIGIGSALVKAGLEACRVLGYSHVFVLGHPEFYPKFGFLPHNLRLEWNVLIPFRIDILWRWS